MEAWPDYLVFSATGQLGNQRVGKPPWQEFRNRYNRQLPESAVQVVAAFVESAVARGGLAVLLCAEPHAQNFDNMPQDNQDEFYCHRFTLASRIRKQLCACNPSRAVDVVCLAWPATG
jgi:hypothetical protein